MRTLIVRLGTMSDAKARFVNAGRKALEGSAQPVTPSINFVSYDDMHRVLAPSRLAIVKALAGQGPLAIREVARRVGRDVQAVHKDVTTLVSAGVIDRAAAGVEFPYDRIHFEFDVQAAA
ncbi:MULTISPECIES: helix-turn-helix domain-containing protein [unclassified Rhizobium]|uniref:HVO_A0114 family putative DNA-binding protein n=1 Tax=unclassified Rhizobium TaxID=2613769 RepID=UPI001160C1B1|nr:MULTISPECIES: helix-turn-helix domain-containing protein [unclassified Rhizobium]MBO9135177.1 transcriptional regulator [Rhizobium sp. B209b/85]QXZ99033.1 transcriptional regulator [Rhizobium sp. B230/85]TQX83445.1 transcriptional regulator [Rhizobium sp. rho-13.1]TQY07030.1 transcriptional regulator [Rhizobium sp. rho-1.1]